MKSGDKIAQMKLSFGMIFSIILIVFFIVFAFYAINKFLNIGESAKISKFKNNIQENIDNIWASSQASDEFEYDLPEKILFVCFADFSTSKSGRYNSFYDDLKKTYSGHENMFFYPIDSAGNLQSTEINHIDINEITQSDNPFCIRNLNGKTKLTLKKDFNEALVSVSQ